MIKNRLAFPNEYAWIDNKDRLHICNYITCDDGCLCENTFLEIKKLKEIVKKYETKIKKEII